jgi:hypothetical protein
VRNRVTELMQLAFDRLQQLLARVGWAACADLIGTQFQLTHLNQHIVVAADRFQFLVAHFDEAHLAFSSVFADAGWRKMPVKLQVAFIRSR